MRNSRTIAVTVVPLVGAVLLGAGSAQAANPKQIVIKELEAVYKGPTSSAGRAPQIALVAEDVARAFVQLTSVTTARKVALGTDGRAERKGDKVQTQGFRCKATRYQLKNPGTAGEYSLVGWRCTFKAADTPTRIELRYRQRSL